MEDEMITIVRSISTLTLIDILEQLLDLEPSLMLDPRFLLRQTILDELKRRVKNSVYATSPAEE